MQVMAQLPPQKIMQEFVALRKVAGCPEIFAHQTDTVFSLWQAWEAETGTEQEVPFWATVWPGAVVFARYILNHQIEVSGKKVLDLGCGGAIAGIAAARAGAQEVIANDVDTVALEIAAQNAAANQVSIKLDSADYLSARPLPPVDVILVADMFYQQEQARRLIAHLTEAVKTGSQVFIADGQRAFAPKTNIREIATECIPVNFDLEGAREREVRLGLLE
jgi:predicted nicotinamide N-methyase